jgi:hypothetical protein
MILKTRVLALTIILWMPSTLGAVDVPRLGELLLPVKDHLSLVEAFAWPRLAAPMHEEEWQGPPPDGPHCHARWAGILKWTLPDRVDVGGGESRQENCGAIFGKVQDDPGNALPGVTVTLTGTKAPWVLVTNRQGFFAFVGLPAGTFTVKAELEGFFSFAARDIRLTKGEIAQPELRLAMNPEDVITIIEETPLINH